MKICFFGSRTLTGKVIRDIIENECQRLGVSEIITALEPAGVCAEAREFATINGIKLTGVPRQIEHNAGMYHFRSVKCYELADYVVLIHDGTSKGTKNEFDLAVKSSMPLTYHCIQEKQQIHKKQYDLQPTLDLIIKHW